MGAADEIELSVWPGSYDFTRGFELDLIKQYADLGVSRVVLSAMEGQAHELDDVRRLIESYQEKVLTKL